MQNTYKLQILNRGVHNKKNFDCGVDKLNTYIKQTAGQEQSKNVAAVYVATLTDSSEIIGFYTLSASSVELVQIPIQQRKKLPKYQQIPVALVGRFAVDIKYQGKGIGNYLLINALRNTYFLSKQIAIYAAVIDPKNDKLKNYYKKFGFTELELSNTRLILPITSIEELIEE